MIINCPVGLTTFREIGAAGVVVERLYAEVLALRLDGRCIAIAHPNPPPPDTSTSASTPTPPADDDRMETDDVIDVPTGGGGAATATGPTATGADATATAGSNPLGPLLSHELRTPTALTKVLLYSLLTLLDVAFQSQGGAHVQGSAEGSQHLRTPALTESLMDLMVNYPVRTLQVGVGVVLGLGLGVRVRVQI